MIVDCDAHGLGVRRGAIDQGVDGMIRRMIVTAMVGVVLSGGALGEDWPGFRGPRGDGTSFERVVPLTWSAESGVSWSVELPGEGNSSPIVWGDRVFVTSAMELGAERALYCFDRDSGALVWGRTMEFVGDEPTHETNPYCAATPVTDGERVYVWYGSGGMLCFDFDGNELWQFQPGEVKHVCGNGSSPILYGDTVIQYIGPGEVSMLVALDKVTGGLVWKREISVSRNRFTDDSDQSQWYGTWATPLVVDNEGQAELVFPVSYSLRGYSPRTGVELWRCMGLSGLSYASASVGDGVAVAMSGYTGPALAVRMPGVGEGGDITATNRLWVHEVNDQRVGSGVVYRGHFYVANDPGVAQCFDLETGEEVWKARL